LEDLALFLPTAIPTECQMQPAGLDPAPAFHGERMQYDSSELLSLMQNVRRPDDGGLLGVTAIDLYIPILTFVFGEAQIGGPASLVSYHRLRQEWYGLPPDSRLLKARLMKEAMHEVGHSMGLMHCQDYRCAMSSSHTVERIDLKEAALCRSCRERLDAVAAGRAHGY
jgi:archaemetzincin